MSPQRANEPSRNNVYFSYLTILLTELFMHPMRRNASHFSFPWNMLPEFKYLHYRDDYYFTILTGLQFEILTSIYFLQSGWNVYGNEHIQQASNLVLRYNTRYNCGINCFNITEILTLS